MKTVVIVQARMGSTRLPGKILKPVLGRPLLVYLLERLKRAKLCDEVVVATTTETADDAIAALCEKSNVSYYRGSEQNVLQRYFEAAKKANAELVVRVTSDCPLMDPQMLDDIIAFAKAHPEYKFITNSPMEMRGEKRTFPRGTDVEIFPMSALKEAYLETESAEDKEHVTPFMRDRPERYPYHHVQYNSDKSAYRLTVDTPEDFELIQLILENLYPKKPEFTLEDVFKVLDDHPNWAEINSGVKQKGK